MTTTYLSKTVTLKNTGAVASAWIITGWRTQNTTNPTAIIFNVNVVGYVSPATLSEGLQPLPGANANYRFSATNFPTGTDLTSVTMAELYTAIITFATANPNDILNGATLATV